MQVHEITHGGRLVEGWMDTAKNALAHGANAVKSAVPAHFVAGLTGQDPQNISAMLSNQPNAAAQVAARAKQTPETPAEVLSRVQNDPQLQQIVIKLANEWQRYAEANQAAFKFDPAKDNNPLSEAVDSGYQPLPGSASGIVVPAGMTRPAPTPKAPAPAAPVANANQQQGWYQTRFVDWARTRLKTSDFDPTTDPGFKGKLDNAAKELAKASLNNNPVGVSRAFKDYMDHAIAAVQIHTARVANRTALVKNNTQPYNPSNSDSNNLASVANTPAVNALLQKANLTPQQLAGLGRALGIPSGQRVKNTGNEQLDSVIRAMGIQVLQ